MKTLLFSALMFCMLASPCRAESIPGYQGWSLELIEPEPSEDGSQNYRQAYYTLKPPDKRPSASIPHRTAEQLLAGELGPEEAYAGGNASISDASKTASSSGVSMGTSFNGTISSGISSGAPASRPSVNGQEGTMGGNKITVDANAAAAPASASGASKSGASSVPSSNPAGERSPASITVDNGKPGTELQVGATTKAPPPAPVDPLAIFSGTFTFHVTGNTGTFSPTRSGNQITGTDNFPDWHSADGQVGISCKINGTVTNTSQNAGTIQFTRVAWSGLTQMFIGTWASTADGHVRIDGTWSGQGGPGGPFDIEK